MHLKCKKECKNSYQLLNYFGFIDYGYKMPIVDLAEAMGFESKYFSFEQYQYYGSMNWNDKFAKFWIRDISNYQETKLIIANLIAYFMLYTNREYITFNPYSYEAGKNRNIFNYAASLLMPRHRFEEVMYYSNYSCFQMSELFDVHPDVCAMRINFIMSKPRDYDPSCW